MWDVVGQEGAVAAAAASLRSQRPPHAYLFVGPPNVGKYRLALQLAQALNCERACSESPPEAGPPSEGVEGPCGQCRQCRRIAAGLHADVQRVTVQREDGSQHKDIRIGQIREVERAVALKPYEGCRRVVIIDPADALNVEAQNAFLKTLEEPPEVTFVLITSREAALLPTIRSRCQRVAFRLLPMAHVEATLRERCGLAAEKAQLVARLAQGRLGWALAVAEDESLLAARAEALATARQLSSWSLAQRFELAEGLASHFYRQRQAVLDTLDIWRQWWRDVLLILCGADGGITNVDVAPALHEEAPRYVSQEVAHFLRAIAAARRHLEDNVNPRLALEALLLEVPSPRRP